MPKHERELDIAENPSLAKASRTLEYKSPLMNAVEKQDLEKVKVLLATCNKTPHLLLERNIEESTVFMQAAKLGNADILKALLAVLIKQNRALVKEAYFAKNSKNETLGICYKQSGKKMDQALFDLFAHFKAIANPPKSKSPVESVCHTTKSVPCAPPSVYNAPLLMTLPLSRTTTQPTLTSLESTDKNAVMNDLLKKEFIPNINKQDKSGNTPLMQMIKLYNLPMILWILAQDNLSLETKNKEGDTALSLLTLSLYHERTPNAKPKLISALSPFLDKLNKLPHQKIAEIYHAAEVVGLNGRPYSVKAFIYRSSVIKNLRNPYLHSLLEMIDTIACQPNFKSAEDIELNERLERTLCETHNHGAYKANIQPLIEQLNKKPIVCLKEQVSKSSKALLSFTEHVDVLAYTPTANQTAEHKSRIESREPMKKHRTIKLL